MFTVEKHTASMTGALWFIVTEDNDGHKVDDTLFYDTHEDAMAEATLRNDTAALHEMGKQAVISHGIDGDNINSDSIDDAVFDGVFGEAVNADQFSEWEAKEISDVLHSAIAETYWELVDEANGLDKCEACGKPRSNDPDFCPDCLANMANKRTPKPNWM